MRDRIEFAIHKPSTVPIWRKDRANFVMFKNGRWGPKWLHRLVFTMARNLGMVGHPRSVEELTTYKRLTVKSTDHSERVGKMVLTASRELGYRPDELKVICGPEDWSEAMIGISRTAKFDAAVQIAWNGGASRIRGVPVEVVPTISGMVVVPR